MQTEPFSVHYTTCDMLQSAAVEFTSSDKTSYQNHVMRGVTLYHKISLAYILNITESVLLHQRKFGDNVCSVSCSVRMQVDINKYCPLCIYYYYYYYYYYVYISHVTST